MLDKWFFALKNMSKLNHWPEQLPEPEFIKLFEIAELDKLDDAERYRYEQSLLYFRDIKNSIDTAIKIGMAKYTSSDSITQSSGGKSAPLVASRSIFDGSFGRGGYCIGSCGGGGGGGWYGGGSGDGAGGGGGGSGHIGTMLTNGSMQSYRA